MKLDTKNQTLKLVLVFVIVLVGSGLLVYAILRGTTSQPAQTRAVPSQAPEPSMSRSPVGEATRELQRPSSDEDQGFIGRIFESKSTETASEGFGATLARITLRLILAASLGSILAFRHRKKLKLLALRRNPYVAETQILLAIVASALMMIVGDNAARAFGIFAAVSLVRFRTNIRDPKEISVLLVSLAMGLATGVGRPDLAVILCVFVLVVLWILENFETQQVVRALDLKITTKNIETTQAALKDVFVKYGFTAELRRVSRDGEELAGTIVNYVEVSALISTDKLSEEILSEDGGNITSIEWEQKKSLSYPYQ